MESDTVVSSIGKNHNFLDDDSTLGLTHVDPHTTLMQRLEDLEKLTSSFLVTKTTDLSFEHDSFSDLWSGDIQLYKLNINTLKPDDVLCIKIVTTTESENSSIKKTNNNIEVLLKDFDDNIIGNQSNQFHQWEGEYCYTLLSDDNILSHSHHVIQS